MKNVFKYWFVALVIITGLSGMIYVVVQQDLRIGANDPQIQLAEDAATTLGNGGSVQSVVPGEKVDIASSLAPYIMVFDESGKPIASSAVLNGQTPTIPQGIFTSVRQNGEDRVTWQPQNGVRSAIVMTHFQGASSGFVVAGRSLREVEIREDQLLQLVGLGWFATVVATFVALLLVLGKIPRFPGYKAKLDVAN